MQTESRHRTTGPQKFARNATACHDSRSGLATIWVVIFSPALLAMLVFVAEISSLWLARVELETAVESGALASAAAWGPSADTLADRVTGTAAAVTFAEANTIVGNTFTVFPGGSVTFGSYSSGTFTALAPGAIPAGTRACVVYATTNVPGLLNGFGGPRPIQARATARFDTVSSTPKLVHIDP